MESDGDRREAESRNRTLYQSLIKIKEFGKYVRAGRAPGIGGMGKMKHRWMAMLVVLVTTVVTAHEAVKQYDDLKAQAGAWATSRLWASLLNTSAPEEKSLEVQPATCSVKETPDGHTQGTWTHGQVVVIKGFNGQQRDASSQLIRIELSALEDKQHSDASEEAADKFERIGEVALLSKQSGGEAEESNAPEAQITAEPDAAQDDTVDESSVVHSEQHVQVISRTLNRAVAEEVSHVVDARAPVQETRSAFETRMQMRAIKIAAKALQNIERGKRIELRIIKRGDSVDPPRPTSISLRAENISVPLAADFPDAPPSQIASQHTASLSTDGTCASEE
jgi:hypothetical protein